MRGSVCFLLLAVFSGCNRPSVHSQSRHLDLTKQIQQASEVVLIKRIAVSRSWWNMKHTSLINGATPLTGPIHMLYEEVRIQQVLKGGLKKHSLIRVTSYAGPRATLPPTGEAAILFLEKEGPDWRYVRDFDGNSIPLPGFPDRDLVDNQRETLHAT